MTAPLQTVEHETGSNPTVAVIWLHGLGADARDFESVVPMLSLGPDRPLRFVFPDAPLRPVTINGGFVMRAWYDVLGFGPDATEDLEGIRETAEALGLLIEQQESRGIGAGAIVLAGFSQGGAMALFTALRYPDSLGGVLALSAYLPAIRTLREEAHQANRGVRIFMAHGEADPVLPLWIGRQAHEQLESLGYAVSWKSYSMMHEVILEELQDIREFLGEVL
jgi:phospholipase/carboxylesterase